MAYKPSRKFITEDGIAIDYELRKIGIELGNASSGDITAVMAGLGLTGGGSSGDVTLTFAPSELSAVTVATDDKIVIADTSDSNEPKTVSVSSVVALAPQGDITEVVAGTALSGGGSSGAVTLNVADVAVAQLADAAVQTSSESFADNDTSLMTSAAIQDKILSYGYITGVTNISGNAGTATALQTARTIGGVSFDGTANIDLAGVNTAGNQNTSGNAATATALATARAINGVNFDGTAPITVTAAAGTVTGNTLNSGVTASSLTSVGTLSALTVSGAITPATVTASTVAVAADDLVLITDTSDGANVKKVTAQSIADLNAETAEDYTSTTAYTTSLAYSGVATDITGNAATATALQTARTINGVSFDGTANITVTAAAGTLTGTELKSTVVTSSLTSVGTLGSLTVSGAFTPATVTASTVTVAADDLVLITDTSDSANVKKVTAQSIADLGGAVTFADGSAAYPSIKFTDDTDTGIYRTTETNSAGSTVVVVGIATDGTVRATFGDDIADFKSAKITTTDILQGNEFRAADTGPASDPSFTFVDDGDSGWYRYAANSLACSVSGQCVWYVTDAGNNVWKTHTNDTYYGYSLGAANAIHYMGGHSSTSMGGIYVTGSGYFYTRAGNAWRTRQSSGELRPYYDSQMTLGSSSARWTQLYADTSTINTSDVNLKTDIVDTTLGLDFIKSLRPVSYKWKKTDGGKDGVRDHQGLIAQEVKAILDAQSGTDASSQAMWCDFSVDGVEDEIHDQDDPEKIIKMPAPTDQALRYNELIGPIIKAVQELSIQMEENKCQCQKKNQN